jgi:hypothetical protein
MLAQRKSSEKAHHLADGDADRYPSTGRRRRRRLWRQSAVRQVLRYAEIGTVPTVMWHVDTGPGSTGAGIRDILGALQLHTTSTDIRRPISVDQSTSRTVATRCGGGGTATGEPGSNDLSKVTRSSGYVCYWAHRSVIRPNVPLATSSRRRRVGVDASTSRGEGGAGVREQVQLNNGSERSGDAEIVTVPCVL